MSHNVRLKCAKIVSCVSTRAAPAERTGAVSVSLVPPFVPLPAESRAGRGKGNQRGSSRSFLTQFVESYSESGSQLLRGRYPAVPTFFDSLYGAPGDAA